MTARVTLYTRAECHLCDEARAIVRAVCAELGESFEEIDVDDAVGLPARYDERFRRMWRYYLAASMAAFRARHPCSVRS